jgi:ATP-binding cassette, subfamily B, heavy metal transporter
MCIDFPKQHWGLEFKAVEFGYGPENALIVPSLRIATGEKIAIIGENAAGKSTLARLISRVYDVRSGSTYVGGEDIRNIQLKSLRDTICYLPRDPVLFDGTLASNLLFVRPGASDRELRAALQLADLDDVVATVPGGLHQSRVADAAVEGFDLSIVLGCSRRVIVVEARGEFAVAAE